MIELEKSHSKQLIRNYQEELISAQLNTFKLQEEKLLSAGRLLRRALLDGKQVFLLGNGGSSSQCNHAEAEFYYWKEHEANDAIRGSIRSLSANPDALTAFANDYGEESLFSIQLRSISRHGDIVLAISTSGNSANIYNALHTADILGLSKIGLLGRDGGKAISLLDICIMVKGTKDTNIIQDIQSSLCHMLVQLAMT